MMLILALYVVGAIASGVLITGWAYAQVYTKYPRARNHNEDLGTAILFGCIGATFWPLFLPMFYLMTGFAQYGWRLKP